jgi:hypothetical protein
MIKGFVLSVSIWTYHRDLPVASGIAAETQFAG